MHKYVKMVERAMEIARAGDVNAGIEGLKGAIQAFDKALESGEIRYDNQSFRALVDRKIAELGD